MMVFGPRRKKVTRNRRNFILKRFMIGTPHQILLEDRMKEHIMAWTHGTCGEKINKGRVLVKKPEGKRQLGGPRRGLENSINCILHRYDERA
jgi:hypothetical protein